MNDLGDSSVHAGAIIVGRGHKDGKVSNRLLLSKAKFLILGIGGYRSLVHHSTEVCLSKTIKGRRHCRLSIGGFHLLSCHGQAVTGLEVELS